MEIMNEMNAYKEEAEAAAEMLEAADKVPETLISRTGDVLLIAPVGRLDTAMSNELKEMLAAHDTSGVNIEMDFANVDYISSAGLRLLVSLQKQAKADGHTMVIKNTNTVVNEVFRVSGFNKAFTVL